MNEATHNILDEQPEDTINNIINEPRHNIID